MRPSFDYCETIQCKTQQYIWGSSVLYDCVCDGGDAQYNIDRDE